MAVFLLWLFSLGFLAFPSYASYNNLPELYKKGVDLAVEKINSQANILHHFIFFRSMEKSESEPGFNVKYFYHNFHLKATKCQKGTVDSTSCKFRNDRPLIDCTTCYKTFNGEIETEPNPYIHCIHRPALTEEMRTTRAEHCNAMGYSSGTPNLLLVQGNN